MAQVERTHEEDEYAFPLDYIFGLREELNAAWMKQLRGWRRLFS